MFRTHRLLVVVCLVVVVLAPSVRERATAQVTLEDRVYAIARGLWIAPAAALAVGALVVFAFIRKAGRSRTLSSAR